MTSKSIDHIWQLVYMIFIIKGFQTIVFIFIVISTTIRPRRPPAFFRCLSNSRTFTELRSTPFIESTEVACSDSVGHNWVQVLSIPVLLPACSQFDKHLKKAGGHIGRNVVEIKTLNDKNHQASSQKFRQLVNMIQQFFFDKWMEECKLVASCVFILVPKCYTQYGPIGLISRVFASDQGNRSSIPGRVIPKTLKTVLDATLLNTQHYRVRIKGKVEQSRERSSALPYITV